MGFRVSGFGRTVWGVGFRVAAFLSAARFASSAFFSAFLADAAWRVEGLGVYLDKSAPHSHVGASRVTVQVCASDLTRTSIYEESQLPHK